MCAVFCCARSTEVEVVVGWPVMISIILILHSAGRALCSAEENGRN